MAVSETYLFTGPEIGEKNEAIQTRLEAARKKYGEVETYKYYAGETRVAEIIAQLQNASLFTPALFVTLRNAEAVKDKSDIENIVSWIKSSSDSPNTLILVSEENSINKKISDAVPKDHQHVFWELFENQKPQWVEKFFRKNGFRISMDAVTEILDMVENNTESLKTECSRFFYCFEKDHEINVDDVDKLLSHSREENAFTLFEALADSSKSPQQRFETALEILQKIKDSAKSSERYEIPLIAGLAYCFRQLRVWHALHSDRKIPTETQLKTSGFNGKKNRERYESAARVWSQGSTASILALLANTDVSCRNGDLPGMTAITLMIYSIAIKNGIFPQTYN